MKREPSVYVPKRKHEEITFEDLMQDFSTLWILCLFNYNI
jgi:hypothetical protein